MTIPEVMIDIAELAVSLLREDQSEETITDVLTQISDKANMAYEDHTGEPLNPNLIRTESLL